MTGPAARGTPGTRFDRILPLGLLLVLGAASVALTGHFLRNGGNSLGAAFQVAPAVDPAAAAAVQRAPLQCDIGSIGGERRVGRRFLVARQPLAVRGWLVDARTLTRPEQAVLWLEDGAGRVATFPLGEGKRRGDIARRFGTRALKLAGFEAVVDFGGLAAGNYTVRIGAADGDARCRPVFSIEVRE